MSFSRRSAASTTVAALALAALIAGTSAPAAGGPPYRFYDLKKAPKPKITGKEIVAGLEDFVERFPMRQNGLPNNIAASEFLAAEAEEYGFKSEILEYDLPPTVLNPTGRMVRVVQSIKKGASKPDEWIAFIAHYDIVEQTPQGAYDDGSGTNFLRFFARTFSKIKTKRSIVLLWFDAEEDGLLASEIHAEELRKKGQKVHAALGFDMTGIGYPARYCICIFNGSSQAVPNPEHQALAVPLIDYVNFQFLGFPEGDGGGEATERWPFGTEGHVCNCGPSDRNSDERNFAERGYFTMRWAGMRAAAHYPGYHQPWDTVALMEMVAGGRDALEKGTENTFLSAYYTAIALDQLPSHGAGFYPPGV